MKLAKHGDINKQHSKRIKPENVSFSSAIIFHWTNTLLLSLLAQLLSYDLMVRDPCLQNVNAWHCAFFFPLEPRDFSVFSPFLFFLNSALYPIKNVHSQLKKIKILLHQLSHAAWVTLQRLRNLNHAKIFLKIWLEVSSFW